LPPYVAGGSGLLVDRCRPRRSGSVPAAAIRPQGRWTRQPDFRRQPSDNHRSGRIAARIDV